MPKSSHREGINTGLNLAKVGHQLSELFRVLP